MTGLAYFLGVIALLIIFVFYTPDWFKVLYLCGVPIYFGIATGSFLVGLFAALAIIGFIAYIRLITPNDNSYKEMFESRDD
jgi:hypothetical protein